MKKYIILLILCSLFTSCKKEYYKKPVQVCIRGHYEEYETGGRSVATQTWTSNRTETRWVCDEYAIDTITCIRYVLK